jgi:hypothetical protein
MKLRGLFPISTLMYLSVRDLYTVFLRWSSADPSWEYINRSQIHECGHWETEHQIIFWK